MKRIIISALLMTAFSGVRAQVPATSYTNGSTNTVPGNPGMPAELYNGTNPAGMPNQTGANSITVPDPSGVNTNTTGTIQPNLNSPTSPNSTAPIAPNMPSQTNPPFPSSQGTYSPNKSVQSLTFLQDPARSPKNPKQSGPVSTVDGSGGKYKSHHKTTTGKDFTTRRHHVKTSKKQNKHIKRDKSGGVPEPSETR